MRPLSLTLRGFTCFRDETTIGLADLEVFAIAGPTGAGKSSILDAMIFALYGKVPRMGKVGCADLISLGRDRLSVTLTFEVRGRSYVVTRTLRRKGAAEAQLDEGEKLLEQGVTDVNRRVERLVGMPYETFLQAVVLPQGDFANFLHSTGGERTKILRGLLRLDVYELMRKAASAEENTLEQGVTLLQGQLNQDFADATPDAVAHLASELAVCVEESEHREALIRARTTELTSLRETRARTASLEAAAAERETLLSGETQIAQLRLEMEAAERALSIEAELREAVTKAQRSMAVRAERAAAEKVEKAARGAHEKCANARAVAERSAAEVPLLRARVSALDKIMGIIDAATSERKDLARTQARLNEVRSGLVKRRSTLPGLERACVAAEKKLESAEALIKAAGYDAKRAAQLDGARRDAQRLDQARNSLKLAMSELSRSEKKAETKARELETAADVLESARKDEDAAVAKREKAEASLHAAQRNDHVRGLHDALLVGAPCPLCEQKVKVVPRLPRAHELDELEERLERAQIEEKKATDACAKVRGRIERLQADHSEATAEAAAGRKKADAVQKELALAEAALEKKVGKLLVNEPGATLEARVELALDAAAAAREAHEAAVEAHKDAREAAARARDAFRVAQAELATSETEVATLTAQVDAMNEKIVGWTARIQEVTQHPEPHVERRELEARGASLESSLAGAKESEQRASAEVGRAAALLTAATEQEQAAEAAATSAREAAEQSARERGFDGIDDARTAMRSEERRKLLRSEVASFDRKAHALADRIAVLHEELGSRRVSPEELEQADASLKALNVTHGEAKKREGTLGQQLETARLRLQQALSLRAEVEKRSSTHAIYRQLARDLGNSEFQQFMLRETVDELVSRASARLMQLSGERYALVVRDDEFYVLDNDNAGEERPAATLSGGETFLTSLALALELSEQVQRAAGAVRLDSLFVDEGFGTLDPEALSVAAEAILSLQVGGRMVGVITHVPELTRLMPTRLLVRKGNGGSSVEVEE